jgi:hypothetical protein
MRHRRDRHDEKPGDRCRGDSVTGSISSTKQQPRRFRHLPRQPAGAAAGAGRDARGVHDAPPAGDVTAGSYYVLAKSDWNGQVPESVETNNVKASARDQDRARPAGLGADAPPPAAAGATFSASDTTVNQGGGAAGARRRATTCPTNSSLDANDVLLGSRDVPALAAGASHAGSAMLTLPATSRAAPTT